MTLGAIHLLMDIYLLYNPQCMEFIYFATQIVAKEDIIF
jgi:hypothetical protein